jgi:hypothetical protein
MSGKASGQFGGREVPAKWIFSGGFCETTVELAHVFLHG